jgi:hypothetical protein
MTQALHSRDPSQALRGGNSENLKTSGCEFNVQPVPRENGRGLEQDTPGDTWNSQNTPKWARTSAGPHTHTASRAD